MVLLREAMPFVAAKALLPVLQPDIVTNVIEFVGMEFCPFPHILNCLELNYTDSRHTEAWTFRRG